jgi:hypothetical protein
MELKEVIDKVNEALDSFYARDAELVKLKVQERSIAHKFAEYLGPLFPNHDIDCEYDKHGKYKKELEHIKECSKEKATNLILPDIVIHKRGHDRDNLVVFEIKSKTKPTACDIMKLKLMTDKVGQFRYDFGFLVEFTSRRPDCRITPYINGKEK